MTDIIEKYELWAKKALDGVDGYEFFRRDEDGNPTCITDGFDGAVTAYVVILWRNGKVLFAESWDKALSTDEARKVCLVMKKDRKLILVDGNAKAYTFGIDGSFDAKLMVYLKFDDAGELLIASGEIPQIRVLRYPRSTEQDAVHGYATLVYKLAANAPALVELNKPLHTSLEEVTNMEANDNGEQHESENLP